MTIKAIETKYKGYRFRSRLEARWAVFFDALGIEWEYEKEGYELSTGERYLPDFWIPANQLWVEVKGEEPSYEYRIKLERFCDSIDQPLLLVIGQPSDFNTELICWDMGDSSGGGPLEWIVHIVTASNGSLRFGSTELNQWRTLYGNHMFEREIEVMRLKEKQVLPLSWDAAEKAKSARFEFGESG